MSNEVIIVSRAGTMSDAAQLMPSHGSHGLAVVDEMGQCLGVLSSSDFVFRSKQRNKAYDGAALPMQEHCAQREAKGDRIVAEMADAVGSYMSNSLQTVSPDTPPIEAAEFMHAPRRSPLARNG